MTTTDNHAPVQIIAKEVTLKVGHGTSLMGRLEYFPESKSLTIVDEETSMPMLLSVPRIEDRVTHALLAADEIMLADWVELRGVTKALTELGVVVATGAIVQVGMFRLHAPVVRVLNAPESGPLPITAG